MPAQRIYENMPKEYSRSDKDDLYPLLTAIGTGLKDNETNLKKFMSDRFVVSALGDGLDIAGENLNVPRIPGMTDTQYKILIPVKAGAARGTIQAIKAVFEAATGFSNVLVQDQHTNPTIPPFEIWIFASSHSNSYGRGGYAGQSTIFGAFPETKCIMDPAVVQTGFYEGGMYNSHWWGGASVWIRRCVDSVRLAGTIIIYK